MSKQDKIHYCYLTEILTENHYFIYVGKHTFKSINNTYVGSGVFVKSAKKNPNAKFIKHILSIQPTYELNAEFEELLVEEAKDKFECCVNIAKGGIGGNIMPIHPMLGRKNPSTTATRALQSKAMKEKFKTQIHWAKDVPRPRRRSKNIPWDKEDELYALWLKFNSPKARRFRTIAIEHGYPEVWYDGMINWFMRK